MENETSNGTAADSSEDLKTACLLMWTWIEFLMVPLPKWPTVRQILLNPVMATDLDLILTSLFRPPLQVMETLRNRSLSSLFLELNWFHLSQSGLLSEWRFLVLG